MPQAQPFLKWVGGKRELLPDLLPYIPRQVKHYYEPFLGGGALFWKLASEGRFQVAYLGDVNADLIHLYRMIRDRAHEFMCAMAITATCYKAAPDPKAFYEEMRREAPRSDIDRAVRFLFLNKACFNGLHRTNKKGQFNSPWGKEVDITFYDPDNIIACSKLLHGVGIRHQPYSRVLSEATAGDFVYFDPPYIPVSKTSDFTSYTADGFTVDDQVELRDIFRVLSEEGVHVMLSNSDTPKIRELYNGFEIKTIKARRNVNSKGDARGLVNEVLVLGKGVTRVASAYDLMAELDQEPFG